MLFQKFPYTDDHQLNLDWIIKLWKSLKGGSKGEVLTKHSDNNFDWIWSSDTEDVYIAQYGVTTSAEIEDAFQAGKMVLVERSSRYMPLVTRNNSSSHLFGASATGFAYWCSCINDTWTQGQRSIASPSIIPPSNLGVPSAGSTDTYARGDHVHKMPTLPELGIYLNHYSSVADIGLTIGAKTLAEVYEALPAKSVLIAPYTQFTANEFPSGAAGLVEMVKWNTYGDRGWIIAHGSRSTDGTYIKFITATGVPDTDWIKMPGPVVNGDLSLIYTGTLTNDASTFTVNGNTATLVINCRDSAGFPAGSWTPIYSVDPAPKQDLYLTTDFLNASYQLRVLMNGQVQIYCQGTAYTQVVRNTLTYIY